MRALSPETLEKYRRVWMLRTVGLTFEEIANAVGYADKSGAKQAYDAFAERYVTETVEQMRLLQSERLDMLLRPAMKRVNEGDLSWIDVILKVERRRSELFGLDAPRKTEVSGPDGGAISIDFTDDLLRKVSAIENAMQSPEESSDDDSGE
jgi:hypothetical protein